MQNSSVVLKYRLKFNNLDLMVNKLIGCEAENREIFVLTELPIVVQPEQLG